MEQIAVTFPSGSGAVELEGVWHPPTRRATNAAVIVLHGSAYNKDSEPSISLCTGAAELGLTALRFDFRYVKQDSIQKFDELTDGLDDLLGAYNFLQGFGKEIKPKRLYLIGKSVGGVVALHFTLQPEYADKISGLGCLGLILHNTEHTEWYWQDRINNLKSPFLAIQGEHDPYSSPDELDEFCRNLPVPAQYEILKGTGHSYEPVPAISNEEEQQAAYQNNMAQAVKLTLNWLEKLEEGRKDLRK
ncbi:MAG: hypothetical protein HXX08_05420 [Chloroflexi bacterium]|uniref:KANL3/Tex30 alpha/beta hydrolase-like domain-containing protein n=1 Tax=Candidatus Chlorohelix allophototropha TaxID=3003348 RepID=A0A8T7M160_9CHLR|nr:hypothetical protein [Chloroflexota bacterium]WJW67176.1 hypothetical protein OZ401_000432 [Chloroflexota bacterium L227-S17]